MPTVIITGSAGLIGSEAARFFCGQGWRVVGIDNDMRAKFFGPGASTASTRISLEALGPQKYRHYHCDIRTVVVGGLFDAFGYDVKAVIHTAAQPSHDWAASHIKTDFNINATGTLNVLEMTRKYCPEASFVFTSTNKVYGDWPNTNREFVEEETRFEHYSPLVDVFPGFTESMPIDQSTHSLFGASKLAADIMVQEYGRYFGMNTVCFRGGCLTGPGHAGAKQHGFLSYLVKCAVAGEPYQIIGHKGKQVRDNIHAADMVAAFWEFIQAPKQGAVYNIGGGRERSCSVLEAIELVNRITGKTLKTEYVDTPRKGDHVWWITDTRKFERDYPEWKQRYTLEQTVQEMVEQCSSDGSSTVP